MAATNYTPIQLYNSGTASVAPTNTNLAAGELALNYKDGILYYKDDANVVQKIGYKLVPIANGGTGSTSTTYCSLTANVAGTLPVGNGGTGAPTFTVNTVLLGNGTSALQEVAPGTNGNVLTSNGTTWASTAAVGGGTVTSVAATVPSVFSIAGSPITSSGTLAMTYSGTALPVANGGTGATALTLNTVLLGNGTSAPLEVAPSTSGNVLTSDGITWASTAPAVVSIASYITAAAQLSFKTAWGGINSLNS